MLIYFITGDPFKDDPFGKIGQYIIEVHLSFNMILFNYKFMLYLGMRNHSWVVIVNGFVIGNRLLFI